MSHTKPLIVTESIKEISSLRKGSSDTQNKRLSMLIEIRRQKDMAIAKRDLAKRIGVDPNSITAWKKFYQQAGITALMADGRIGFKPSVVSAEEHKQIEQKLKDPQNGIRGYVELQHWVKTEPGKDLKYITLLKYAERHFGSKIKVARKSHVKKDEEAVITFKKNLVKSAKK
jgi:transposase